MNYKHLAIYTLIAFGLILLLSLLPHVGAIETNPEPTPTPIFLNTSSANTTEFLNHTYEIHRILQGDKVYLGDHIDISGVVAGNFALAWWPAGYPTVQEAQRVIPLPNTSAGYYDFYIDPDVFSQMTGH